MWMPPRAGLATAFVFLLMPLPIIVGRHVHQPPFISDTKCSSGNLELVSANMAFR